MSEEVVGGVRKRAVPYFWCTLIAASGASVAGNIAHAVLAHLGHTQIAAAAEVVPPAVAVAATHGVALLVRARTTGATYWCALVMTVVLASGAFVLNFDALRELALTWAGFPPATAWLWPVVIDLGIAQSTLALLALSGTPRTVAVHRVNGALSVNGAPTLHNDVQLHQLDAPGVQPDDWGAAADELISSGVTRIERDKAATVLAELAAGTAPSTVARKHRVGYATVARIAETTKRQDGQEIRA
jgi:hypothetical protein